MPVLKTANVILLESVPYVIDLNDLYHKDLLDEVGTKNVGKHDRIRSHGWLNEQHPNLE